MSTKLPIIVNIGDLVRTPAGREARVVAVDTRRGEADVVMLEARASFTLANLTPLHRAPEVVILNAQPTEEPKA